MFQSKRILVPLAAAILGFGLAACGGTPTYTVTSTNDIYDGTCNAAHCSLREAIILALAHSGTATIKFNIGGGGPQTIQPTSALPAITKPMVIDGRTQPGYTNVPLIEIDGSLAGAGISGLRLEAGATTINSLVINRFSGNGIHILAPGGNEIHSNYIGTDQTGTAERRKRHPGRERRCQSHRRAGRDRGRADLRAGERHLRECGLRRGVQRRG